MPWHTNAVYFTGTLGVLYSQYIPWVLLCYIVPILSLIAAATGYGIWYVDPETGKVVFITIDEIDPVTGELKVTLPFLGAITLLDKSAVDENEIETQTTDAGAADTETAAE